MTTCIRRHDATWSTCKCDPCTQHRHRMAKLARNGHYARITPEQAWAVLLPYIEDNYSSQALASATGTSRDSMMRVIRDYKTRGHLTQFTAITCKAIVAMSRPTAGQVGATVPRRKLRALAVIGHGLRTCSEETGVSFSTLASIRIGRSTRTLYAIADAIAIAYIRLCMTPGTEQQAIDVARRKGWHGPLAWDDIDDINETPCTTTSSSSTRRSSSAHAEIDPVVVERLLRGENIYATKAEQEETVRRIMADPGRTLVDFAALSHLPVQSIAERIKQRARRAA